MTPWRSVQQWCDGGNTKFGTCFLAMFGNWFALTTGEVMTDGEVENAYSQIAGFSPLDPATDHGVAFEIGLEYLRKNGWPPDPSITVTSWAPTSNLAGTIARRGAAFGYLELPMNAARDGYDFSDDALARKAPGEYGHAVLIVDASPPVFVTWANPQGVSDAWLAAYGRAYEVVLADGGVTV